MAEVEITPPVGVEMAGYGPFLPRQCTEVLDPLYARALWLHSGGEAVALVSVDLCMPAWDTHRAAAAQLQAVCGLKPENLLIAGSHTHSGPATSFTVGWGERDPGYMAALPGLYAQAVLEARRNARPARLGASRVRVDGVAINREQFLAPVDTAAQLLRIDSADGRPLAAALNFGAHPVLRWPFGTRLSAD